MSKRRIIWGAGFLLTILLFYFLLPANVYFKAPILLSLTGALLFLFFSVQLVGDFRSWEELNTRDKSLQDWRHKVAFILVIPAVIFLFVLAKKVDNYEKDELSTDGIVTTGIIKDGSKATVKRSTKCDIVVEYKVENDRLMNVSQTVTESEFDSYSKGQQVTLVYSKKHPDIFRILSTDEAIEKYTGVKNREVGVKDLIALMSMKHDSINSFLNTISYSWEKHDTGWVNERNNQYVNLSPKTGSVTYIGSGVNFKLYQNLFKLENFQELKTTDSTSHSNRSSKIYFNDNLVAAMELGVDKGNMLILSISIQKKNSVMAQNGDRK
jgi:hypothetical protein